MTYRYRCVKTCYAHVNPEASKADEDGKRKVNPEYLYIEKGELIEVDEKLDNPHLKCVKKPVEDEETEVIKEEPEVKVKRVGEPKRRSSAAKKIR